MVTVRSPSAMRQWTLKYRAAYMQTKWTGEKKWVTAFRFKSERAADAQTVQMAAQNPWVHAVIRQHDGDSVMHTDTDLNEEEEKHSKERRKWNFFSKAGLNKKQSKPNSWHSGVTYMTHDCFSFFRQSNNGEQTSAKRKINNTTVNSPFL